MPIDFWLYLFITKDYVLENLKIDDHFENLNSATVDGVSLSLCLFLKHVPPTFLFQQNKVVK